MVPVPTKLSTMGEAQFGHLSVPALYKDTSESETSIGVTPSKELCKCVTSTGILSKGRA